MTLPSGNGTGEGDQVRALVVVAMALLAVPALAASADTGHPLDVVWAPETHGLAGSVSYRDGVFLATDYVFDDGGAGGFSYPDSGPPYNRNAADLVELRVLPDNGGLTVGVRLNTLLDPDVPVVAVGLAPPGGPAEALPWPHDVGVVAVGVRWVVTLRPGAAELTDLTTGASAELQLDVHHDTPADRRHLENTLTTHVPAPLLDLAGSGRWRIHAAAGLWGDDGWHRPAGDDVPAPYDLMFTPDEEFTNWQRNRQAELLAGGDITAAAGTLDFGRFPDHDPPTATGRQTRIYRSAYDRQLGEGITSWELEPGTTDQPAIPLGDSYRGLFLPYAVWIPPDAGDAPLPVFFTMHGFGGDHLGLGEWERGEIDVPAIAFSPLGRAPFGFYIGENELDVMEAFADLRRHYPVDDDRVYVSGTSMGGFGTYRLAVRYPDLFAAAVPLIGTADSAEALLPPQLGDAFGQRPLGRGMPGGGRESLENVLNVPFRLFNGQLDPIVNNVFVQRDLVRFAELGYDHRYYGFTRRHHETVAAFTNVLYDEVLGIRRDPDPARVVYRRYPAQEYPEYGLVYDGAYWVSGLEARQVDGEASFARIDATSHAHGAKHHGPGELIPPSPGSFDPTDDPYLTQGHTRAPASREPENGFGFTVENVGAVELDLARMAIDTTAFSFEATGDGETVITLVGAFDPGRPVVVRRDGEVHDAAEAEDGALVIRAALTAVPARFEVGQAAMPEHAPDPEPAAELPATGRGLATGVLLLAGGLGAQMLVSPRRRRRSASNC
jgi:hypothetical protein